MKTKTVTPFSKWGINSLHYASINKCVLYMLKRTYRYASQQKNTSWQQKSPIYKLSRNKARKQCQLSVSNIEKTSGFFLVVINRGAMLALAKSMLIQGPLLTFRFCSICNSLLYVRLVSCQSHSQYSNFCGGREELRLPNKHQHFSHQLFPLTSQYTQFKDKQQPVNTKSSILN